MNKYIVLILWIGMVSCTQKEQTLNVLSGDAFGTTYSIQYYSENDFDALKGIDSVFYVFNRSVNTYMPESDISRINRGDSTVVVDHIFRNVFVLSEKVFKDTEGYFDPTIGVLRNAYGFGDVEPLSELDAGTLDSLRMFVGFNKVRITSDGTVIKDFPEIYFDFNAVAKGYGVDCLGNYLKSQGVTNFLIELGGEILASGINIDKGAPWLVGVESVRSQLENRSVAEVISLANLGMASSGNYRKFRIDSLSGKKYVHTINPLTGQAEQGDITSATVLAQDCATADAYATAFMAMGFERTTDILLRSAHLEAYITYVDSLNIPQVFMTDGFRSKLQK